jgi:deoxyribodipyrimidine photo-lyase
MAPPAPAFVPSPAAPPRGISAGAAAARIHPLTAPLGAASVAAAAVAGAASAPALSTQLAAAHVVARPDGGRSAGGPVGTVVVLFRADLRVDDHAPLVHAAEEAACVVPVVCFDPRHFGRTAYGFEKTGRYRACFLLESVRALRETVRGMGCDVVVRIGKPEEVVVDVCKRVGAKRVFLHTETTFEEQEVEAALEEALGASGAQMKRFWGNSLYHVDDIPFGMDDIPDVYSDFRESVEKRAAIRPPLKAPSSLAPLPAALDTGDIPTLADLSIDDGGDPPVASPAAHVSSGVGSINGGEPEALRRVQAYVDESRRADAELLPRAKVGPHLGADFSCRISPWLALGCVSPRRIFEELRAASAVPEALTRSPTYLELVWRDFFRFITCKYSQTRIAKVTARTARASAGFAAAT